MVSTRGPRYKFSEGERVLCYEPDPTKAKVLYDSKVLEVIERKDKRGRRTIEYLIHFQGWNSSWDRCVGEELVLKDTEGNRQLQRSLADKAQLQIGAYLYRRERKKVTGPSSGKRPRIDCDGESSAISSPEDEDGDGAPQSDSCVSSSTESSCDDSDCDYHSDHHGSAAIPLGPGLRQRLTQDYELVVCGGLLVSLPCRPSALQLLEDCVRHHTTRTVAAHTPPPPQADVQEQVRRLNILRQVADGLRIYLDFILRDQLLYEGERQQYQQAVADGTLRDTLPPAVKREEDSIRGYPEDYSHLPPFMDGLQIKREAVSPCEEPESSPAGNHREPSPAWHDLQIKSEENTSDTSKETTKEENNSIWDNCTSLPGMSVRTGSREVSSQEASRTSRDSPDRYSVRENRHSSGISEAASDSQLDPKENDRDNSEMGSALSSQEDSQSDSRPDDGSRVSGGREWKECEALGRDSGQGPGPDCAKSDNLRPNQIRNPKFAIRRLRSHRPRSRTLDDRPPAQPGPSRTTSTSEASVAELNGGVAEEFRQALDWRIVPSDHPPYPAAVYGAIHLARLFVKLPEYLSVINMPDSKLELVVEYVEYFVQYLEEHEEWFGESLYYDPNPSTS